MPKTATKTEPFIVIDRGLRILVTPCEGRYAVQGMDVRGLNTQGRTIEEAIAMAHDAAQALAEARMPNRLTVETLEKSERGEEVFSAKNAEDLFAKIGI